MIFLNKVVFLLLAFPPARGQVQTGFKRKIADISGIKQVSKNALYSTLANFRHAINFIILWLSITFILELNFAKRQLNCQYIKNHPRPANPIMVRFIAKHSRAARRLDTKNGKGRFVRKSAIEFARFGFITTFDLTKKSSRNFTC